MKFIVTGGASIKNNLGDQAMIFTLIEFLRRKYDDVEITVFDEDAYFSKELVNNFNFKILPDIPMIHKIKKINRILYLLYKLLGKGVRFSNDIEEEIIREYETCDYIFQIAGFGLSSQMEYKNVLSRLWDLAYAKKLKKKITMLPQSIGPFDYSGFKKILFSHYLRKLINYPDFVLCREKMGRDILMDFGCAKAEIEYDIVVSRPNKLDYAFIGRYEKRKPPEYDIDKEKDVVLVPNFRFLNHIGLEELCGIYKEIISECIRITNGKVYIFNHEMKDDRDLSYAIYERFSNDNRVILIDSGFDCLDVEEFFKNFAMGIATRWHSYVHMIRTGLPAVIIGWAEKYLETASDFKQMDNLFDIRRLTNEKDILQAVKRVYNNRADIAGKIVERENEIKKTFCLERITKHIAREE